jgi:hypothetical protein
MVHYWKKMARRVLMYRAMKKHNKVAKLAVKTETVRNLSEREMKQAAGGIINIPTQNLDTARCQDWKVGTSG